MTLAVSVAMQKAEKAILRRLEALEARLQAGEESAWPDYLEAAKALATIAPVLAPGASGQLLTTGEAAARLGVSVKTLLKRKARGEIRPAVERGKLLRWSGKETL